MKPNKTNRIHIIGAGYEGLAIAAEVRKKPVLGRVVAFIDDSPTKIGSRIDGIPVIGPLEDVVTLLRMTPNDEAIIAIPSAGRERLRFIYHLLERAQFSRIRILPGIAQIIEGEAHLVQTREIDPQDLLARNPVQINLRKSLAYLRGKRVLITGAGGSIGSELARQLLSAGAERLYLLGHGENSIYEIDKELRNLQAEGVGETTAIVPIIGELQDRDFVGFILARSRAQVIFHTAAYKHVPMMEANPVVAVKNNVFGTLHLLEAAAEAGCDRVVLISTDKVVEPASVYGATKSLSEAIFLRFAARSSDRRLMVVRFGNVLGSRGSILPLFRKQILQGGPVTITDRHTSRFFMTIPEASSLVLQAGGVGDNGQVYVLDMGEPLMIQELAEQMVRFYGFEPWEDIRFEYIGLRPGEKQTEALFSADEQPVATAYPRINRISRAGSGTNGGSTADVDADRLDELIAALRPICFADPTKPQLYRNRTMLRAALRALFPSLPAVPDEPEY